MARIGEMKRDYVKGQFAKMAGGGDLVDDAEVQGMAQQQQAGADQVLAAQQRQMNQQAMASQGQGIQAQGQATAQAQGLAQTSANAAISAKGEAQKLAAALRERRTAEALAAGERLQADNRQATQQTVETVSQAIGAANEMGKLF